MSEAAGLTDDELQLLDPVLRIVAQASGLAAAVRMAQKYGGVRVYVPELAAPDHHLVELIGQAGLKALVAAYPSEYVTPSKAGNLLRAMRNQRMHLQRETMSLRDLAMAHRLTRRRVEQIMAEGCGQLSSDQYDLFG